MEKKYENEARVFKALCDPNRLKILDILKSGEHCACQLLEILNVSQSTLSHHMKILADAHVVEVKKVGKWSHYTLSKEAISTVKKWLDDLQENDGKEIM